MDDIARTRLDAEDKLHLKAADTLHRELLQELDRCVLSHPSFPWVFFHHELNGSRTDGSRCRFFPRFPLVERAVADVPALADPEFAAGIRRHAENLVRRSRGGTFRLPSPIFPSPVSPHLYYFLFPSSLMTMMVAAAVAAEAEATERST